VLWQCWLHNRKGIRPVKGFAPAFPKDSFWKTLEAPGVICGRIGCLNQAPCGFRVVRIDLLRLILARCHKRQLNQSLSFVFCVCVLLRYLPGPLLCIVSLLFHVFCILVVLVKLSVLAKWLARKTSLRTPISWGDYLHKDQAEEQFCVFYVDLAYCLIVYCPALYNIFHMSMSWCSLFVLNVP